MNLLIGTIEQGLTYSFLAIGLYFAYRILDFPDLTVDGSFPLGAAVSVTMLMLGINPYLSLVIAALVGALAGLCTGFIHIKLGVKDLLAGLIMQTALYSINLKIAGQANVSFFNNETIFSNSFVDSLLPASLQSYRVFFVMIPIVLIVKVLLDLFLKTKAGFLIKATGDNPVLVKTMAKDPGMVKIQGLAISNALVALSGAIVAQEQRFFEISMGTGAMVMGLASLIIGLKVFGSFRFMKDSTKVIFGSIIYKLAIMITIMIGFSAESMKLVTAVIFLVILVSGHGSRIRKWVK